MYDFYTVELRRGVVGEMTVMRHHRATSVTLALNLIDGLREAAHLRDNVTWQGDEVDAGGNLYGLAPGGIVYQISCVPPLTTELATELQED